MDVRRRCDDTRDRTVDAAGDVGDSGDCEDCAEAASLPLLRMPLSSAADVATRISGAGLPAAALLPPPVAPLRGFEAAAPEAGKLTPLMSLPASSRLAFSAAAAAPELGSAPVLLSMPLLPAALLPPYGPLREALCRAPLTACSAGAAVAAFASGLLRRKKQHQH